MGDWWDTEQIPEEELQARIALIFEQGNSSDLGNCRPIALLGAFYKIYAACIRNRITTKLANSCISHNMASDKEKHH